MILKKKKERSVIASDPMPTMKKSPPIIVISLLVVIAYTVRLKVMKAVRNIAIRTILGSTSMQEAATVTDSAKVKSPSKILLVGTVFESCLAKTKTNISTIDVTAERIKMVWLLTTLIKNSLLNTKKVNKTVASN